MSGQDNPYVPPETLALRGTEARQGRKFLRILTVATGPLWGAFLGFVGALVLARLFLPPSQPVSPRDPNDALVYVALGLGFMGGAGGFVLGIAASFFLYFRWFGFGPSKQREN